MVNKIKQYGIDRRIIFALFLITPLLSVISFPAKYTFISVLFISCFIYYYSNKGLKIVVASFPLIIWLILTVFHWINAMQKGVPEVDLLDLLHGAKIYVCIAIFAYLARRSFDATIQSLVICFNIYMLMSFVVNDVFSSNSGERMSGVITATGLGQTAAISGIYVAYYSLRKRLTIARTSLLYILPILVILFTQSRNALAMLAIGMVGHAIAYTIQRGGKLRNAILAISLLGAIAFFSFDLVVSNTALGERLADTETAELSNEKNNRATNTIFDKIAGDRLVYYVVGWDYFEESPLTGIGMWNYRYLTQGEYPLHSEYMVHLAEGGIVGASLWLIFIVSVVHGVFRSKQFLYIKIVAIFSILEILFCGIYARVFFYEFFYPVIGIAISMVFWRKPDVVLKPSSQNPKSNFDSNNII